MASQGHHHELHGMETASTIHNNPLDPKFHTIDVQDYVSTTYEANIQKPKLDIEDPMANKTSGNMFKEPTIYKKAAAELLSTFILVLAGCGAIMIDNLYMSLTDIGIAAVFGLTVMAMVYTVGHISGAHMNPAVSIAFSIIGALPLKELPIYMVAQIVGATMASAFLKETIGHDVSISVVTNDPKGRPIEALIFECILTFILLFVLCAMVTDPKAQGHMIAIAMGGTVVFCALLGAKISGPSMNPARSLGPAFISGIYKDLWVYIFGPIVGAIFGAWAYKGLRLQ